jgi:hypothetical protein
MKALSRTRKIYGNSGNKSPITNFKKGRFNNKKRKPNGGFNGEPTVSYSHISDDLWNNIDWTK